MSRPVLRAAVAAVAAVAAGLVSGCVPERAFVDVDAVGTEGGGGVLVLVSRADSFSIWRAGDEWTKLSERSGTVRACAWHEGRLWIFHKKSVSTYIVSEDAVEWASAVDRPFDWSVEAADSDGRLWVCGVQEKKLRAGVLRAGGWAELPPGPDVSPPGYLDILADEGGGGALVAFSRKRMLIVRVGEKGEWAVVSSRPLEGRAIALASGGKAFIQAKSRPASYSILWGGFGETLRPVAGSEQRSVFGIGWALCAAGELLFSSDASELRAYAREGEGWRELSVPDELKKTPVELRVGELLIVLGLATVAGILVFAARLRRFLRGAGEPPSVAAAPWAMRGLAWAIDSGVVVLVSFATALALFGGALFKLDYDDPRAYAVTLSWHGISCIYCLLFELIWGVTPGKKLLGLEVVMEDGSRLRKSAALVRNLMRLIDQYPFPAAPVVGLASMMLTSRQQRLGDLVAGTVVARGRRRKR